MKATLSQLRSTSSNMWDDRRMVAPLSRSSSTSSTKRPCIRGSKPLVGSSRSNTSGRFMNAHTRPTFCLVPFDILRILGRGSSSKRSMSSFIRVRSSSFLSRAMNSRNAKPLMSSGVAISPGRWPRRLWMAARSEKQSSPKMCADPDCGLMNPIRWRMVTVLPAPLLPRKPKTSPCLTANDRSNTPRPCP